MISCKEYVEIQKEQLKEKIKNLKRKPRLVVVQIGNNAASNTYVKGKKRDSEEIGIDFEHIHISDYSNVSQEEIEMRISNLNECKLVDGIIIQLPIPDKYNVEKLQKCISPEKDVDGFRIDSKHKPCTPKGIIDWLKYNDYDFVGKKAIVLGRSKIVGKPMVDMLIDESATVTCCNSRTSEIIRLEYTQNADLIVSAVGKPKYFNFSDFVEAEVIVDVGINRDEYGKLCGDIDTGYFEKYLPNTYVTPVPGGVGILTRISLMNNVIEAYELLEDDRNDTH